MSVRRRFFTNEIADLIIKQIDDNVDLNFINTVSKGDFSMVPDVPKYELFFPAIYLDIKDLSNATSVNKSIAATKYLYNIEYIKYYDKDEDYIAKQEAIDEAQLLADTLLEDKDLNLARLEEGMILKTEVPHITFNTEKTSVFSTLELPVIIIDISYNVYFRSFIRR